MIACCFAGPALRSANEFWTFWMCIGDAQVNRLTEVRRQSSLVNLPLMILEIKLSWHWEFQKSFSMKDTWGYPHWWVETKKQASII